LHLDGNLSNRNLRDTPGINFARHTQSMAEASARTFNYPNGLGPNPLAFPGAPAQGSGLDGGILNRYLGDAFNPNRPFPVREAPNNNMPPGLWDSLNRMADD